MLEGELQEDPLGTTVSRHVRMSLCLGVLSAALAGVTVVSSASPAAASISFTQTWTHTLSDTNNPVALSSPNVANLPGGPAAVVGDRAGNVVAYYLNGGGQVPGWPFSTGGVAVDSTPSVTSLN